jgi:hypothetical protein
LAILKGTCGAGRQPAECPPDVQIFTSGKRPCEPLGTEFPAFAEYHDFGEVRPPKSLAHWQALLAETR